MRKNITIILCMLLGCDAPNSDFVEREAPDEVLVGEQLVSVLDFAGLVEACDGVEDVKLTISLTSYPLGAEHRVIGLGISTMATLPLYECWREQLLKLGATP